MSLAFFPWFLAVLQTSQWTYTPHRVITWETVFEPSTAASAVRLDQPFRGTVSRDCLHCFIKKILLGSQRTRQKRFREDIREKRVSGDSVVVDYADTVSAKSLNTRIPCHQLVQKNSKISLHCPFNAIRFSYPILLADPARVLEVAGPGETQRSTLKVPVGEHVCQAEGVVVLLWTWKRRLECIFSLDANFNWMQIAALHFQLQIRLSKWKALMVRLQK